MKALPPPAGRSDRASLTAEQASAYMKRLSKCAGGVTRLVARRLLDLDHGDGAWPGYRSLAEYAGCSEGSARRALSQLEQLGAIVSERRTGLGNLVAYIPFTVESWRPAVTRNRDTDSLSPETVTPDKSASPSLSPSVSPSLSLETVRSIQQGGSSEQDKSRRHIRAAGAKSKAPPTFTRADLEAQVASLQAQADAAPNEAERKFFQACIRGKRQALAKLAAEASTPAPCMGGEAPGHPEPAVLQCATREPPESSTSRAPALPVVSHRRRFLDRIVLGVRLHRRLAGVADEDVAAVDEALDQLERTLRLSVVQAIKARMIPLAVVAEHQRRGALERLPYWRPPGTARARVHRTVAMAGRASFEIRGPAASMEDATR